MPYCSQTDMERVATAALVLRLCDDDNDGQVDSSAINDIVDDATAEANSYVGRVYSVATVEANPPTILRRKTATIAIQYAYLRRPEFLNERGETPWQKQYADALAWFTKVAKGEVRLDVDNVPAKPANVKGAGLYTSTGAADSEDGGFVKDGAGDF